MKSLSALDIYFLMREFSILLDSKVEQIYQKDKGVDELDVGDFLFRFHTQEGKILLHIRLPGLIYISEQKGEFPQSPPGFCSYLRKHLNGSRLKKIEQVGFERIIKVTFERKRADEITTYLLFIELFSKGNIIVCDDNLLIKNVLIRQSWAGRELKVHESYKLPPSQTNTPHLSDDEFVDKLLKSEKTSLVKALAIDFSLGGSWSEEVCIRGKIDKDKQPKDLNREDALCVFKSLHFILGMDINASKIGDVILPFKFDTMQGECVEFKSFSAAIDASFFDGSKESSQSKEKKVKELKVDVIIREQTAKIAGFEIAAVENQRKGEIIYEHYTEVKDILEKIREARKTHSWKEIKEHLKGHKIIKEIDEKEGRIVVDLE